MSLGIYRKTQLQSKLQVGEVKYPSSSFLPPSPIADQKPDNWGTQMKESIEVSLSGIPYPLKKSISPSKPTYKASHWFSHSYDVFQALQENGAQSDLHKPQKDTEGLQTPCLPQPTGYWWMALSGTLNYITSCMRTQHFLWPWEKPLFPWCNLGKLWDYRPFTLSIHCFRSHQ